AHRERSGEQSRHTREKDELVAAGGAGESHDEREVRQQAVVRSEDARPKSSASPPAPDGAIGVGDAAGMRPKPDAAARGESPTQPVGASHPLDRRSVDALAAPRPI